LKRKIVLVNQHTAYLFIDITNAFAKHYDEVVLIAGVVHPLGNELNPRVKVQTMVPYNLKNIFTRAFSWIIGFIQVSWYLLFRYRAHEVFLYSNPPLLSFLPLFFKRKMSHLIVDVYPDIFVTSGILKSKKSIVFRIWKLLNKKALKKFHSVSTITDVMAEKVQKYTEGKEVPVVNLWPDQSIGNHKIPREQNIFFKTHNLNPNNIYVIYSGNLGKGHDVQYLIEVARHMSYNKNVIFIIAGEGFKKQMIKDAIVEWKLDNCLWMPYQEKQVFKHMLAAMDIGVVTIDEPNAYVSIPSKTFNIIAAGKPIICFGKKDSELGKLVNDNGTGKIYSGEDLKECVTFIEKLSSNQEAYNYFSNNSIQASKRYSLANAEKFVLMHSRPR